MPAPHFFGEPVPLQVVVDFLMSNGYRRLDQKTHTRDGSIVSHTFDHPKYPGERPVFFTSIKAVVEHCVWMQIQRAALDG